MVAFLAVLGVDVEKQTFRDPYAFTSSLSGLIKMAQMLVAQRAVQMADHVLRAKPVVLMTSYLTKDFVEEQENGCPIGQLYIQMYAVRGR